MMSFLDTLSQLYLILVNFINFGAHFNEVSWHVQRKSSKFKALKELSLAIRLSI